MCAEVGVRDFSSSGSWMPMIKKPRLESAPIEKEERGCKPSRTGQGAVHTDLKSAGDRPPRKKGGGMVRTLSVEIYRFMKAKVLTREWRESRDATWEAIQPYLSPPSAIVHHDILKTAAELGISISDLNVLIDYCTNAPYEKKLVSNRLEKTFWICIVEDEPETSRTPEEPPSISQEESFRRLRRRIRW